MFKKDVSVGGRSKVRQSIQRKIKSTFLSKYPLLAPHEKEALGSVQWDKIQTREPPVSLYVWTHEEENSQGEVIRVTKYPLFYETKDNMIPHLKLVHRFPECFHTVRIDRGAIRFVLSGAILMAPGLTSPGGRLPDPGNKGPDAKYGTEDLPEGAIVAIEAEGKEYACMVGSLKRGTKVIKAEKKGPAMDDGHYVGDGLWRLPLD